MKSENITKINGAGLKPEVSSPRIKVGILGATGTVGQKFIVLLQNHPWFEISVLAASENSAGKKYTEAVEGRWVQSTPIPDLLKNVVVKDLYKDMADIAHEVKVVFCAVNMPKDEIKKLESDYAAAGVAVVSNNSANRWTDDVPMIMPEINPHHSKLIDIQRKARGWDKGLIVVKPNCSIQSYVPAIQALQKFNPEKVIVTTFQAISGAGKTFESWPEMLDNVIPLIKGEEEKSEKEPLRIWGEIVDRKIVPAVKPEISANCIRVPVSDGHMALVNISFAKKPTKDEILNAWKNYINPIEELHLPSAPKEFIKYFEEEDRPQTKLDRDFENGMGITLGRLREDNIMDWKFVSLSHNTVRGAAGGAILTAELLYKQGYIIN